MTYEYKLEPTSEQTREMTEWLEINRRVYNYALAERRDWIASRKCNINACNRKAEYIIPTDAPKPTYASQCKSLTAAKEFFPNLKKVYSQVLQQTLQRLEKAFIGMWEQERGYPRFKKPGMFRSFLFPQLKKSPLIGNHIDLPKLGKIKIRLHRPIPDGFVIKQIRILRRASGWYALLSLQCNVDVPEINPHGHAIGIDVGLDAFVATSSGELINRPKFFGAAQHKLKLLNRVVARKKKGSKNQHKARQKVARFYEKIAHQRKAFHIQTAHYLCDKAQTIYAEDLNLLGLAKGMLAKHCLDAGWGSFLDVLGWICWKRGAYFEKVDARGTSQTCPVCETYVPKDLSIRIHECPECGYRTNRDIASAQLVLKRGIAAAGLAVKKSAEDTVSEAGGQRPTETKVPVKQKHLRSNSKKPTPSR